MRSSDLETWSRAELEGEVRRLREAMSAVQESDAEVRYRALFEAIDDGFCIIEFFDGPDGPLSDYMHIEANSGYERHTGIQNIVGKTLRQIAPTEVDGWLEIYGGVLASGKPIRFERHFVAVDRHIEVSASRIEPASLNQVSVLFRDISARKMAESALVANEAALEQRVAERTKELMRTEEQLRHSQKMEAVGQLTGGIAHDFNNLLAGISGSLEMMQSRLAQGRVGELDRYVTGAQGATKRAAALTQRLLAFSRRQTLDPKPADINRLALGMQDLITRSVGPMIEVETALAGGLWASFVDVGQLENALLNLCINARDAMPDGGKLTIETANRWFDERASRQRGLIPGQYISLCVSDTGVGMSPEIVERAFDPFFTTKPTGSGTGLGLSMVHGFAGQSGGTARIYSEVGKGTMVCIYLPRHLGKADAEEPLPVQEATEPVAGHETVLVVDDEPLVRMIAVEILEDLGYNVIEAGDGPEAMRFLNSDQRIELLVTDVGLPGGMNGRQLADAARDARPELGVLFITGYAENAVLNHGHLEHGMQVMTKPFRAEDFVRRIRDLLP